MAATLHIPGPTEVSVQFSPGGTAGPVEVLGYTIEGVDIELDVKTRDVYGDQNGGQDGPPIDIQQFGQLATVRGVFNKFDSAVMEKIKSRSDGATTPGQNIDVGCLLAQENQGHRLVIKPTKTGTACPIYNFAFAVARQPIPFRYGSKVKEVTVNWQCHAVAGVLYTHTDPSA